MGVIAFNPMLKAGYDVRLASGVITAGGTLGILIPPSVMIIVYAAVAGQSVVKLYAAAMFPGFFLSFLYLVYIVGWALINPKIAPQAARERDPRAGAGVACRSSRRRYSRAAVPDARWRRWSRPATALEDRRRGRARHLRDAAQELRLRAGAARARRRHALRDRLVVRRHSPAAGHRAGGDGVALAGAGAHASKPADDTPQELGASRTASLPTIRRRSSARRATPMPRPPSPRACSRWAIRNC